LPDTGEAVLTKTDSTPKEALAGVTYNFLDGEGNIASAQLVTNDQCLLSLPGLKPGKYQLIETAASEGYEINNAPIDFEVTAGKITNVSAEDVKTNVVKPPVVTPEPGKEKVALTKTYSATGIALAGAEYSLLDAKGDTELTKLVTNDQGLISHFLIWHLVNIVWSKRLRQVATI